MVCRYCLYIPAALKLKVRIALEVNLWFETVVVVNLNLLFYLNVSLCWEC